MAKLNEKRGGGVNCRANRGRLPGVRKAVMLLGACLGMAGASVDNVPWQSFLSRYLDTSAADHVSRVRYGSVTQKDRKALEAYLKALQGEKVSALDRDLQRAYWLNLYNAATVAVVLSKYPVASIQEIILPGSPKPGPWDSRWLKIEGKEASLNDIENVILRPGWKDFRIHFGLNCASLGCPSLPVRVFTPANTDSLLEAGARAFINSPRGVSFQGADLHLSSLFDWYKTDFGRSDREVLEKIARFAAPGISGKLASHRGKIVYQYDWKLNDAAAAKDVGP